MSCNKSAQMRSIVTYWRFCVGWIRVFFTTTDILVAQICATKISAIISLCTQKFFYRNRSLIGVIDQLLDRRVKNFLPYVGHCIRLHQAGHLLITLGHLIGLKGACHGRCHILKICGVIDWIVKQIADQRPLVTYL